LRNPRASQIRHNKHKTTMTSPTNSSNPFAGHIQPFKVGKYKAIWFTVYKGNTQINFHLEFVVVKRTPKFAVFLIDGKEYRRKIQMPDHPTISYVTLPDPYNYNWDLITQGAEPQIVGRLDKPFVRNVQWVKTRRLE
jgi:hypothetical protein